MATTKRSTLFLPLQLIVVSPVRMIREGLASYLRNRIDVSLADVLAPSRLSSRRMDELRPNVVLIDVAMQEGLELGRKLKLSHATAKLLAFAVSENVEEVFACAAAGFSGYVPADSSREQVLQAIRDVADGQLRCPPHIAGAMFEQLADLMRKMAPETELSYLTERENEILALVAVGLSNKEIARWLGISRATVKNHMHNVLQKLHVGRRGKAVALLRSLQVQEAGVAIRHRPYG